MKRKIVECATPGVILGVVFSFASVNYCLLPDPKNSTLNNPLPKPLLILSLSQENMLSQEKKFRAPLHLILFMQRLSTRVKIKRS
jgi:hypothetical protein